MRVILQNGTLITPEGQRKADIATEGSLITDIADHIEETEGDAVYDVAGCIVFPGFIDGHTHLDLVNDLGHTADNFETGTRAAVCGGTTTCMDFATQEKGDTLVHTMEVWKDLAKTVYSNYGIHMSITDWNNRTRAELKTMTEEGITTYKTYLAYGFRLNDKEQQEVLGALKEEHAICGVHCEDPVMLEEAQKKTIAAGILSPSGHPLSHPAEAEAESIRKLCAMAEAEGAPVHVVHLSSSLGLEEVRKARKRGVKVYAETCPQYLLLDDSMYDREDGEKFVLSPPLRKPADIEAIRGAVLDGEIQTIATDHCPFNDTLKKEQAKGGFFKIPGGAPGVEHRPALVMTTFENDLSYEQINKLLSENPAKLFHLYPKKGALQVGSDADITVWDPNKNWTISKDNQHQNVDYTPYEGFNAHGKAKFVFVNGKLAAEDGEPTGVIAGQFVRADQPDGQI